LGGTQPSSGFRNTASGGLVSGESSGFFNNASGGSESNGGVSGFFNTAIPTLFPGYAVNPSGVLNVGSNVSGLLNLRELL